MIGWGVSTAVGLPLLGVGGWYVAVHVAAKKAAEDCRDFGAPNCSDFDKQAKVALPVSITLGLLGWTATVLGIVGMANNSKRFKKIKAIESEYQLSFAPSFDGRQATVAATLRF